jgi:hypothetical protein
VTEPPGIALLLIAEGVYPARIDPSGFKLTENNSDCGAAEFDRGCADLRRRLL